MFSASSASNFIESELSASGPIRLELRPFWVEVGRSPREVPNESDSSRHRDVVRRVRDRTERWSARGRAWWAAMTDAEILAAIAPPADDRWRRLFGMPLWGNPVGAADEVVDALVQLLYDLDVGVSFDWLTWYWPGRYPGGEGLAPAPVADSVRMLASYLHGDRVAAGALRSGLVDGSIPASINRLWDWYRECRRRRGRRVRRSCRVLG